MTFGAAGGGPGSPAVSLRPAPRAPRPEGEARPRPPRSPYRNSAVIGTAGIGGRLVRSRFRADIAPRGNVRAGTAAGGALRGSAGPGAGGRALAPGTFAPSLPTSRIAGTCGQDARGPGPRLRRGKHFRGAVAGHCGDPPGPARAVRAFLADIARCGNVRAGRPRTQAVRAFGGASISVQALSARPGRRPRRRNRFPAFRLPRRFRSARTRRFRSARRLPSRRRRRRRAPATCRR